MYLAYIYLACKCSHTFFRRSKTVLSFETLYIEDEFGPSRMEQLVRVGLVYCELEDVLC